ncbi:BTB/POZ domain-containing protein KCTD19-like [Osmerus mordax]|uniref:BTB/POZ domain-containing protein KCTD19-like n=1 Tax=Osmerus mordax TaxID=8014 RepID=UPI00350F760B
MADGSANQSCFFNVGGCFFSIPRARLSYLQDSLLFKDSQNQGRWFIDRDGCTFRHVQYYLQTGKLATSCSSEINILYELTASLRLSSLLQALEHFQSGKHYLRARPVDLQIAERATLNYWKTRICNKKLPELIASPVSSVHDAVPLGLIGTPLIDGDEEVLYCFLPMEQIRLYPDLVTPHNLLWLCDNVAIIECDSPLFRFIANFLQTGKIVLPEQFSDYERLNTEARSSGMFDFMKALQESHEASFDGDCPPAAHASELSTPQPPKPLYEMTFDLLVRYQDSALGQLYVDGDLPGNKLYMCGNGVVFQHVENWLGTSRLPLTESGPELQGLCEYLDQQDEAYQAFKEVLWEFLLRKKTPGGSFTAWPWSASVATFSVYKVVKVYVGTHWYATYFKTLLKYPELLSNVKKTSWIVFGESLLVKGDGQMFRHVLNFLRCGRLLLPSEFREWQLLLHEIGEFQIPSLSGALEDCTDYRVWTQSRETSHNLSSSSAMSLLVYDGEQHCFTQSANFIRRQYQDLCNADKHDEIKTSGLWESVVSESGQRDKEDTRGRRTDVELPPQNDPERQRGGESVRPSAEADPLPAQASARLSALTALFSRQRLPRGPTAHTHPTHTAKTGERSRANPYIVTQPSGEGSGWNGPALRSCVFPVRGCVFPVRGCVFPVRGCVLPVQGSVVRVDHPAVLGRGEPGGCFTQSVIYTASSRLYTDVAFACFSLSYEEMVYGRQCHAFLTGVILDSVRLQDSQDNTVKIANLVYALWTGQTEVEDFVSELMRIISPGRQKQRELLQRWLKLTLTLAQRYTSCLELLGRQHCHMSALFPGERSARVSQLTAKI